MRVCGYRLENGDYPCDIEIAEEEEFCRSHMSLDFRNRICGLKQSLQDRDATIEELRKEVERIKIISQGNYNRAEDINRTRTEKINELKEDIEWLTRKFAVYHKGHGFHLFDVEKSESIRLKHGLDNGRVE